MRKRHLRMQNPQSKWWSWLNFVQICKRWVFRWNTRKWCENVTLIDRTVNLTISRVKTLISWVKDLTRKSVSLSNWQPSRTIPDNSRRTTFVDHSRRTIPEKFGGMFLIFVKTWQNLFDFRVYLIDIFNSRVKLSVVYPLRHMMLISALHLKSSRWVAIPTINRILHHVLIYQGFFHLPYFAEQSFFLFSGWHQLRLAQHTKKR